MTPERIVELRHLVRHHNRTWVRRNPGLGPCYPIAQALVELGFADRRLHGFYRMRYGRQYWHHWVGQDSDGLVDISGPWITSLNAKPEYREFSPDYAQDRWNQSHVDWWKERLK